MLFAFSSNREIYPQLGQKNFTRGETLHFKMNYGIFTIGKGTYKIHERYYKYNNRYCYKIEIVGKTVGMVDWVADVDDYFGAYVDTAALVPHHFFRKVREGHYKKDEWTYFDHENKKIEVRVLDNNTGKLKPSKFYEAPDQVRDLIGGYLFLRTVNFDQLTVGDTLSIKGFFEDEFYDLQVIYMGKDIVRTRAGKFHAILLVPIMPDNKLFDGENSVRAWFSDDENRIPIKISADMFIGNAGVELVKYSGLRNPVNLVK